MSSKREFMYIFVIMLFLFGTATLCTIIFYDSEKAILGISVGSTLVSIILAVLAIIYTYVDSSAQKENVYQMRTAAENLAKSVEDEKSIIAQFSIELQKVTTLKDELLVKITETQEWREGVLSQLKLLSEGSEEKTTIKIEDVQKLMAEETEKQSGNRRLMSSSKRKELEKRFLKY